MLNARGRHRLDHLMIGPRITPVRCAQRPRASSSGSHGKRGQRGAGFGVLNARGRHRLDHLGRGVEVRRGQGVLNARGRHRLDHSRTRRRPRRGRPVLNARGRHRLDHESGRLGVLADLQVLNARGRHRLDHRWRGGRGPGAGRGCSTPEGVIVWITRPSPPRRRSPSSAQRPRASSSGSPACGIQPTRRFHSAQRPRASSSGSLHSLVRGLSLTVLCSTPEGVIVWITSAASRAGMPSGMCSTPEGVIVWITGRQVGSHGSGRCAQRPRASSSGSRRRSRPRWPR